MADEVKSIHEELTLTILLADRLIKSALEAESSTPDCSELAARATQLCQLLRATARLTATSAAAATPVYGSPIRRVTAEITKILERAFSLVRKCSYKPKILHHVLSITSTADFRKLSSLLENSTANVRWLLSIFDPDCGITVTLPPIASNDPILAWVWAYIAAIQIGRPRFRVEAAQELASLTIDNDRNKKIIVEEKGVPPLLKLLKESNSPEAQIAAATALYNLADNQERVTAIASELGVQIVCKVLAESPMRVQIAVVNLISRMADLDRNVQEDFGRQNVTRRLITLLGMDFGLDSKELVDKEMTQASNGRNVNLNSNSSDSSSREADSREVRTKLKVACSMSLWKLAKKSLPNSSKIAESKALICFAKIIEKENGELQINSLMTVMELAAVAESKVELKRAVFKPNSPAARAILDQLLRVTKEETNTSLVIPAVKAIGYLARTFPAKETRVFEPLVALLEHGNKQVAREASIALGKFVSPDNFNHIEHSKAIVELNAVPKLMDLIRANNDGLVHDHVLLCYLTFHFGNIKAVDQARALKILEGYARYVIAQRPDLKELWAKALQNLTLYQAGDHPHRHSYAL